MEQVDSNSFKWPSWLPIQITSLGITWPNIQANPADFALTLSAKVKNIPGVPLDFEGSVNGLTIDVGLLQQGKFPITALESLSVKVGGDFGGAEISGSLIGGILKIDSAGNLIDTDDTTTLVSDRVLFVEIGRAHV